MLQEINNTMAQELDCKLDVQKVANKNVAIQDATIEDVALRFPIRMKSENAHMWRVQAGNQCTGDRSNCPKCGGLQKQLDALKKSK